MTDETETQHKSSEASSASSFSGARRTGLIIAFVVFGVFGVWATTAPIDGAAHAPGNVVVRSHTKVVQHLDGGIISEILVDNGDRVEAGDPLVVLDKTQSRAELDSVNAQLVANQALAARLKAERDGKESLEFPEELKQGDAEASAEMASQIEVFNARRESREGRINMLEERASQLRSRLTGLQAMKSSKEELMSSYAEELEEVRSLLDDGFSDTNRLRSVQRNHESLRGEIAELDSNLASTRLQLNEAEMEILQIDREFYSEVVSQLGETQTRVRELKERRTALRDVVDRQTVRAPDNGIINGMDVHTVGGVISRGSPIAEVVPEGEELIIEARVSPMDIDRVAAGQEASVRFPALSAQTTPRLNGTVVNVSADAHYNEDTGNSYYLARIGVSEEELEALGDLRLVPGMPADVFINSGSRTLMQYLLKPLTSAMARSFIED